MSRRIKHLLWIVVTGLVLGLSSTSVLAAETAKAVQRDIPVLVAQLSVDAKTTLMPVDFNITDVSIDGNRLTLHGMRRDGNEDVAVTLNIASPPKRTDVKMPVPNRVNHDAIFNRDDDH